ncbi:MAG: hypothetical protein LBM74_02375 [Oscillospiraceae bacterium]|jgi:amidase|nr:hypothetical protein [Oscillospiraceae bacterium]
MSDLWKKSATELVSLLRSKQLGVAELTAYYLDRIARYDQPKGLRAVAEIDETAMEQAGRLDNTPPEARGPLAGLPLLIKDNTDVQGLHTTAGSLALSDMLAERDAPVIARLRQNGAVMLGKTNMTEFANYMAQDMPNGFSSRGGQVVSTYGTRQDPGGSSTGSGVAAAAGFCGAAIGTDTSFSVVGCAMMNGISGLKPPIGALSCEGVIPIAHSMDSPGPLARTAGDVLMVYQAMREAPLAPIAPAPVHGLRIAVNTCGMDKMDSAEAGRIEALLKALRADGCITEEVNHPYAPGGRVIMQQEFRPDLEACLAQMNARRKTLAEIVAFYEANPTAMPHGMYCLTEALKPHDAAAYDETLAERERLRASLAAELGSFDACLMTGWTNVMHVAGLPSLALRLGESAEGLPQGLLLYGADERRLYAAALAIENYCSPGESPAL